MTNPAFVVPEAMDALQALTQGRRQGRRAR